MDGVPLADCHPAEQPLLMAPSNFIPGATAQSSKLGWLITLPGAGTGQPCPCTIVASNMAQNAMKVKRSIFPSEAVPAGGGKKFRVLFHGVGKSFW